MNDIYVIENIQNGKIYIGSSNDGLRRKNEHFSFLNRNTHPNSHLQASYNKYGKASFVFEIVSSHPEVTPDRLVELEMALILEIGADNRDIGYNLTTNVRGTGVSTHTEESKQKISNTLKILWQNASEKLKTACRDGSLKRWRHAPESHFQQAKNQAKIMGDANKGKKRTEEFKANRAKYVKEQNQTQEQFKKKRIVDDLGTVYTSIGKAAIAFNVSAPTITRYIKNNMPLNGRRLKFESF